MAKTMAPMVPYRVKDGVMQLKIRGFIDRFASCLPKLLNLLCSDELRSHPTWSQLLPYDVAHYSAQRSRGHCIRPDIILTPDGPRICELDFVPSGRGFLLAGLSAAQQQLVLRTFAKWYIDMRAKRVAYATGTTTVCWEETLYFAELLRPFDVDIEAVNVDSMPVENRFIDRLFYRSELAQPLQETSGGIITAEPYLDSKLIMALIHDGEMEQLLIQRLGLEDTIFLQECIPETFALNPLRLKRPAYLERLVERKDDWVIKNAGVESDDCWGSRGVVIGRKYSRKAPFRLALIEGEGKDKKIGARQVLQRYSTSYDFTGPWDEAVAGTITTRLAEGQFGKPESEEVRMPATEQVYARLGAYFLVSNEQGKVRVPPFGIATLRQDELAHGASNARALSFEII